MRTPIISKLDHQRLQQRIRQAKPDATLSPVQLIKLLQHVETATLLDPTKMPTNVVTMRSVVSVEYVDTGRKLDISLVYPEEADPKTNRVSIFAPLATALLGCQRGALTSLPTPFGSIRVRVTNILYQPEAAGDYSL